MIVEGTDCQLVRFELSIPQPGELIELVLKDALIHGEDNTPAIKGVGEIGQPSQSALELF